MRVGRIRKPHGVEGLVKILIEDAFMDSFFESEVLFIEQRGGQVPFFVEDIREGNEILVKFEEVDTREAALELSGKEVFLREQDIQEPSEEQIEALGFRRYVGFVILDKTSGRVGVVEEVIELPQQWMAVVDYRGKEVFIPLNDAFIMTVNTTEKTLEMDLPAGLLDL